MGLRFFEANEGLNAYDLGMKSRSLIADRVFICALCLDYSWLNVLNIELFHYGKNSLRAAHF